MVSGAASVGELTVLCDAHGVEPACDDIFGLQVGAVGGSDGGCGGAELCGTHTEVCGEAGAEGGSLLGASVDAEEKTGFSGDTENGHGAVGAGAADGVEPVGDGGHFFKLNADGACGGSAELLRSPMGATVGPVIMVSPRVRLVGSDERAQPVGQVHVHE